MCRDKHGTQCIKPAQLQPAPVTQPTVEQRTHSKGYDQDTFVGTIICQRGSNGKFCKGKVVKALPNEQLYVVKYTNGKTEELTLFELERAQKRT